MTKDTKDIQKIKEACLANAESFLSLAEREVNKGADHICFHLALLALEEIGKSILVTIGFTVSIAGKETGGLEVAMDDHIKKIFWALWGGAFRDNKFTKEQIEQSRGLASTLHERRLLSLYTDPNNPTEPNDRLEKGEAERLIKLTRARLELEKLNKITDKFEPHIPRGVRTRTHGVSFSKEREETEFPRTTIPRYGTMSTCSSEVATVSTVPTTTSYSP